MLSVNVINYKHILVVKDLREDWNSEFKAIVEDQWGNKTKQRWSWDCLFLLTGIGLQAASKMQWEFRMHLVSQHTRAALHAMIVKDLTVSRDTLPAFYGLRPIWMMMTYTQIWGWEHFSCVLQLSTQHILENLSHHLSKQIQSHFWKFWT